MSNSGVVTGGYAGQAVGEGNVSSHVAGSAAERVVLGAGKLTGADLERARACVGRDEWRVEEEIRRVEHRLRPEWRAIRALADRLLEVGHLDGAEAEEILRRHLTPDGSREVTRMAGRINYLEGRV